MKKLFVFMITLLCGTFVNADDYHQPGPYITMGGAMHSLDDDIDLNFWEVRATGGYRFNPYIAVELSVAERKLDDDDENIQFFGDATAIALRVLPMLPISDKADGYLVLGYEHYTAIGFEEHYLGQRAAGDSESDFIIGIGAMWHITEKIFIRSEVGTYAEDAGDSISIGLDVGLKF